MKGREGKGPPSADLIVCFPTRAHLTLMPKPICSPARQSSETSTRHQRRHNHHHRPIHDHQMRKTKTKPNNSSPLLWAKTKHNNNSDISEPTSPKVTCAGQIKVRPKPNSCKNWQSVMEEIERLHNNRKQKKRPPWIEALGFKKDAMQFLTCLRNIRFDFRCFGSFPTAEVTSDDEEEDDDDEEEDEIYRENTEMGLKEESDETEESRTVFSKWFMILQENNQSKELITKENEDIDDAPIAAPPKNALLLMRCRSAPAKSWLEEKAEKEKEEAEKSESGDDDTETEEKKKEKEEEERLVVMRCGTDFSKFSSDIAKETWVVGGIKEMLSRSRSWKR